MTPPRRARRRMAGLVIPFFVSGGGWRWGDGRRRGKRMRICIFVANIQTRARMNSYLRWMKSIDCNCTYLGYYPAIPFDAVWHHPFLILYHLYHDQTWFVFDFFVIIIVVAVSSFIIYYFTCCCCYLLLVAFTCCCLLLLLACVLSKKKSARAHKSKFRARKTNRGALINSKTPLNLS